MISRQTIEELQQRLSNTGIEAFFLVIDYHIFLRLRALYTNRHHLHRMTRSVLGLLHPGNQGAQLSPDPESWSWHNFRDCSFR